MHIPRTVVASGAIGLALVLAAGPAAGAAPPPEAKKVDFIREVRPLLAARCLSCHGTRRQRGGLRLDRKDDALAGGDSGPVIRPGNAAASRLIRLVAGAEDGKVMPPKGERLTPAEVATLRAWIDQGADWPATADIVTARESNHWAFRPPKRHEPPEVRGGQWVRNPIDRFILARLEKEGVKPSPEAGRHTLIRRLSLDLTGLPPTPEEVRAFVEDARPDAYERLVDRLLASPRFGEQWARHWLDLARYADSDGYGPDRARPNAWRWRDWVITAINRDLPFDRFTIEQLAGDLLPDATADQKIAAGFHRHTLHNREAGTDQAEDRGKRLVDRVATTGTVWLGLTLGCAECHSHKYDPVSQREFYRLYAFFNNADEVDAPVPPTSHEEAQRERLTTEHTKTIKAIEKRLANRKTALRKEGWEERLASVKKLPAKVRQLLKVPAEKRTPQQTDELFKFHVSRDATVKALKKELREAKKELRSLMHPTAMTFAPATKPRPTRIHIRGDFLRKGAAVTPGVPAALGDFKPRGAVPDRLDLARWVASPGNPLTARVAANRVWQHLFGKGLVATPEDFGTQGEPPTHPELLDWLATEYVRLGWSRKALVRRIVTSSAYRQSSGLVPGRGEVAPPLQERDPKNDLLARQNRFRIDAEGVRDYYLSVGGLLNGQIGGPSFRPPMPPEVRAIAFRLDDFYTPDTGDVLYRRGLYLFRKRGMIFPMLSTFDAPDTTEPCARRPRSNTPLQALTLLNGPLSLETARSLARRVMEEYPADVDAAIRHAFLLCLARPPDDKEIATLRRLYDDLLRTYRAAPAAAKKLVGRAGGVSPRRVSPLRGLTPPARRENAETAAWIGLARALLNLDELLTRE